MKIFEALRQDHEKQRLLLKILAETSGDTAARREYYQELKTQLESHAIAEERHFYSHLLEKDATADLTRHGIAEHHEIDELLAKLDDTDMSSPAWLRYLKALQEKWNITLLTKNKSSSRLRVMCLMTARKQNLLMNIKKR